MSEVGQDGTNRPSKERTYARASSGWLIECKVRGVPAWWNGMRFDLTDDKAWDFESTKAIVFADWASAESTLNNLRVETMQRSEKRGPHAVMERMQLAVTEHQWGFPDETTHDPRDARIAELLRQRDALQRIVDGCTGVTSPVNGTVKP